MPGRHEAPKQSDSFIGLVVLALLVLLAVVIILSVALVQGTAVTMNSPKARPLTLGGNAAQVHGARHSYPSPGEHRLPRRAGSAAPAALLARQARVLRVARPSRPLRPGHSPGAGQRHEPQPGQDASRPTPAVPAEPDRRRAGPQQDMGSQPAALAGGLGAQR